MELSLLLNVFLALFISKCYAVDINYINIENDKQAQQEMEYVDDTDSRRNIKPSQNLTKEPNSNTTAPPEIDDDFEDYEDTDFKIISIRLPVEKKRHKTTGNQTSGPSNKTSALATTAQAKQSKPTTPISLYTDFQYDIDAVEEEEEENLLRERLEIPENITKDNVTKLKFEFLLNNSQTQNGSNQNIYSQFYNLEPAALLFDFRNPSKESKNVNTWYVPENRPCWDLPLLYGELGKSYIANHVFVINPTKLRKVLDQHIEKPPGQKSSSQSGRNLDRWCGVSPCFGDHTLCLFSKHHKSHICDVKYTVKQPNMVEQVALVNTLNSMRNHVAKGTPHQYPRLPPAANMQQVIYDYDLEAMAAAWLRQCLPGPAPCSALDAAFVAELECTKFAKRCCHKPASPRDCTPKQECFIDPIIGCLHTWFWSAKNRITDTDVKCGHVTAQSYSTVQLIWAKTDKIGCAYGTRENGDIRVVCNFAPGAPFKIRTKFFCGILAHNDLTNMTKYYGKDVMDKNTQLQMGIDLGTELQIPDYIKNFTKKQSSHSLPPSAESWGIISLRKEYKTNWLRHKMGDFTNGTKGAIARLVTRYRFWEETKARCDLEEPMYEVGPPGALCVETGRKFYALCYDFRDPSPSYRLVAVLAPLALFSLILYDLFSSVMRQTNY